MIKNIWKLEYTIELLSGLHIGGSSENFDIGGADSNVIKNPITNEPYIPGSSIKGKLRSLLEYRHDSDLSFKIKDIDINNLFEPVEKENQTNITRAIFRDMQLTLESKKELQLYLGEGVFTEVKAENKIKRLTGTAENPRFIERVPSGACFTGEIIITVFDGDNEEKMKNAILDALSMLEMNYLGGSGSRGYGRVKIHFEDFEKAKI